MKLFNSSKSISGRFAQLDSLTPSIPSFVGTEGLGKETCFGHFSRMNKAINKISMQAMDDEGLVT